MIFQSNEDFHAYGLSHGIVVSVLALCLVGLFLIVKKRESKNDHFILRVVLAAILFFSVTVDIISPLLRSGTAGLSLIYYHGLPLYKSTRLTEVGYVWALAGTAQGLVTPELVYEWPALEFIGFFVQHGFVPIAAILAVWGFGWKPERGAFYRVWLWTWVFMASVMMYNFFAGTNYSYLNEKPELVPWVEYLGPHPWYLVSFHVIALILYLILLTPFKGRGVFRRKA